MQFVWEWEVLELLEALSPTKSAMWAVAYTVAMWSANNYLHRCYVVSTTYTFAMWSVAYTVAMWSAINYLHRCYVVSTTYTFAMWSVAYTFAMWSAWNIKIHRLLNRCDKRAIGSSGRRVR